MSKVQTDREKMFRDFVPMMFVEPPAQADADWIVAENTRIPTSIASVGLFDQTVQYYRPDVSKVSLPSLMISGGAENKLLPTRAIRFVHENIFGSQFSPYEDSRHCPFPEETERSTKKPMNSLDPSYRCNGCNQVAKPQRFL